MAPFREHQLASGRTIRAGKDENSNDELVKATSRTETMLHTKAPGSPFVRLGKDPSKEEIGEAAIFCAKYSQDWRDHKQDVIIHVFLRADMKKTKAMKAGTWHVTKHKTVTVKKAAIVNFKQTISDETKRQKNRSK